MAEANIPVYLILGFLDSGKSTLLQDTLEMDYFMDGQRTVLIRCEDGEIEYDEGKLKSQNTRVVSVDSVEELTPAFLDGVERRFQPQRVLMEYNGMWPMDILREMDMPKGWGLYQVIMTMDGSSLGAYLKNMPSQIMDMVSEADMIVVNRCEESMPLVDWKRSFRATNRNVEVVFEGEEDEIEVEEIIPYDLDGDVVTIEDEDYGIFYLDILDHHEKYVGKTVNFKGLVLVGENMPQKTFVPGRNVMTCCEDDVQFFGLVCIYDKAKKLRKGQWVELSATVKWEFSQGYEKEGPVLYATEVTQCEAPEETMVQFR